MPIRRATGRGPCRRSPLVVVLAAVAPAVAAVGLLPGLDAAPAAAQEQSLRWRPCQDGFECASLTVPLDRSAPTGRRVALALIRDPARDPQRRIGSLVVNPGGPGGSGVDFVMTAARTFPSELRDRFDIVGFDPRGVGRSDPVDCKFDMSRYYSLDFSPDDAAERDALLAGVRQFVDSCVAHEGDRLAHLSTDDTVADLEALRIALGEARLTFVGFSYGTYLGAKYAAAHPDRVRAFVLDGAIDPALDAEALQVEQAAGFEGVLDSFLRWCARRESCAFHRDGRTERAFDRLRARVDRQGLTVPDARPERSLSPVEFELGLAAVLYEGRAGFPFLGEVLDAASRGDGTAMAQLADSYTDRRADGSYGGIEQAFLAISCADGPPVGGVAGVRRIEERAVAVAPRTGAAIVNNSLACAFWPVVGAPAAPVRAPGAPPILVVGTRRDPATPFEWARSLASQLGSGVLVSAPGSRHTAFGLGNPCVDGTVVRYLVDLRPPARDLAC